MVAVNGRVFWQGALILYLVPVLLIAWQADDVMVPALVSLYGVLSLLVFARLLPKPERVEVPVAPVDTSHAQMQKLEVELERRDERIAELEGSVRDLTGEIRTLLQLEGEQSTAVQPVMAAEESWVEELPDTCSQQVRTQYDAYILLQRCIQKAQQLPGGFSDVGVDNAMEMRQLYDAFRDETAAIVMAYSRSEGRPLFANSVVQAFCGFEPEVFVRNFEGILRGGRERWQSAIQGLGNGEEASVRLIVSASSGQSVTLDCCMGVIPSGPFKGLVVAVFYR